MAEVPASLWQNRSFLRLWFAQIVSNAGTAVTSLALPLTAVIVLHVTPAQMGLLLFAGQLPNILFGLLAGVWVDRTRRRPILVGADLGRALLLGSIPIAAFLDHLTFLHLWIVAFLGGTLSLFFQIASVSVLPSLVTRNQLVEANSKLAISDSVIAIAGPSIAGGLVQLVSAPKAIIADAVSYVVSALSLGGMGASEKRREVRERRDFWREIGEGMRAVVGTPILLALTGYIAVSSVAAAVQGTVRLLFLIRELHFSPAVIGLIAACNGGASLLGAMLAGRIARRIGIGYTVILSCFFFEISVLFVPLAGLPHTIPLLFVMIGNVLGGSSYTVTAVNQTSLRQAMVPAELMGRTTGARRFLIFCGAPVGAALGGLLGGTIGLRSTLFVGVVISLASFLIVLFSPVRHVRDLASATIST